MSKNDKYVLIIGSSNMDLNIYLKRFPMIGETVTGGSFKKSLGGKGANQAVASFRSGSKTIFIGKIGKDSRRFHRYRRGYCQDRNPGRKMVGQSSAARSYTQSP